MASSDGLFHGKELDRAIEMGNNTPPPDMLICESALDSRVQALVKREIEALANPKVIEECRQELIKAGAPFDDVTVDAVNFRSTLGGVFTLGIATGLALACLDDTQDSKEVAGDGC